MTREVLERLSLEDIDLILQDQTGAYSEEEKAQVQEWLDQLVQYQPTQQSPERVSSTTIRCPKCGGLNHISSTHCQHCGCFFSNKSTASRSPGKTSVKKEIQHPYTKDMYSFLPVLQKIFISLLIAIAVVGVISAFVASNGLSDWAEEYSDDTVDIPVSFFGYFIELESDTFGGSPFVVFLNTILNYAFIWVIVFLFGTVALGCLETKQKTLDSVYHSEKLLERLLEVNLSAQQKEAPHTDSSKSK